MTIEYKVNHPVTAEQFIEVLSRSTLGERRPMHDQAAMAGMLANSNLIVSAWHNDKLVGIARSVTDYHFCCYLSDLAIDQDYQHQGIGKQLQILTKQQLGQYCTLILLAAPAAKDYYGKIGYDKSERCWVLEPGMEII